MKDSLFSTHHPFFKMCSILFELFRPLYILNNNFEDYKQYKLKTREISKNEFIIQNILPSQIRKIRRNHSKLTLIETF